MLVSVEQRTDRHHESAVCLGNFGSIPPTGLQSSRERIDEGIAQVGVERPHREGNGSARKVRSEGVIFSLFVDRPSSSDVVIEVLAGRRWHGGSLCKPVV